MGERGFVRAPGVGLSLSTSGCWCRKTSGHLDVTTRFKLRRAACKGGASVPQGGGVGVWCAAPPRSPRLYARRELRESLE